MVSEEKLKALLERAGKVTATSMRVTPTMISLMVFELLQSREEVSRVRKLEAEKKWLAEQCVKFGDKKPRESVEYWLNAADRETRGKK